MLFVLQNTRGRGRLTLKLKPLLLQHYDIFSTFSAIPNLIMGVGRGSMSSVSVLVVSIEVLAWSGQMGH